MSFVDQRSLQLLGNEHIKVGDHYRLSLFLKNLDERLSGNRKVVKAKLHSLRKFYYK